jgi:hypothetical protein
MYYYSLVPPDISAKKISLANLGTSEPAWRYEDLMRILPILRTAKVGVLGGDVLVSDGTDYVHSYDSWGTDHEAGETDDAFSERSIARTLDYLGKYPNVTDPKFAFLIVCTGVPSN